MTHGRPDPRSGNLHELPPGLPVPVDDGACDHLAGLRVPALALPSTQGRQLDLSDLAAGLAVLYVYPRTGKPGAPPPDSWDAIPGARGCTPQSCAFRDDHGELAALGALVAGLSAQGPEEQHEFSDRERLPFPLLSDPELRLADALSLPTFEFAGARLYRRVTLVLAAGSIETVFYPVFPPDRNAQDVLDRLRARPAGGPPSRR